MTNYYEHVYMALRKSMIDRDNGDKIDHAVLVDMGAAKVALKESIPSTALLIAYSMLYYPGWLKGGYPDLNPVAMEVEEFLGGVNNPKFPLLYNIQLTMVAAAIGSYAKLWELKYSKFKGTTLIIPNLDSPLVQETRRRIAEEGIQFKDARNTFIELMKSGDYSTDIPLADDYIANATFIADAEVQAGEAYEAEVLRLDLAEEFEEEHS